MLLCLICGCSGGIQWSVCLDEIKLTLLVSNKPIVVIRIRALSFFNYSKFKNKPHSARRVNGFDDHKAILQVRLKLQMLTMTIAYNVYRIKEANSFRSCTHHGLVHWCARSIKSVYWSIWLKIASPIKWSVKRSKYINLDWNKISW